MSCPDEIDLMALAAGELGDAEVEALHLHLDACSGCRNLLATAARLDPTSAPTEDIAIAGACVGRYLLLSPAGRGAMGEVFAAWDPDLDRKVAVKVLTVRPRGVLHEARAAAKVSHPNVVVVHDVGEAAAGPFIAMEFLDGGTLRGWLRTRRTWRDIVDRFLRAAEGLAAAHDEGVVHRDFKPENVLLGRDGRLRVTDFGLAQVKERLDTTADAVGADATMPGGGTPLYMAPEQHDGETVDGRADQYAFCVALHEALYGVRPFEAQTLAGLRNAIARGDRTATGPRPFPRRLAQLLERGLARDPQQRFESMAELADSLRRTAAPRCPWALVGGALGAIALGGIVATRAPSSCEAPTPIWGDAEKEMIGEAFSATKLPHADAVWSRTRAELDAYSEALTAAEVETCEGRRRSCLAPHRAEAAALVEQLEHPDRGLVGHAIEAAMGLPPVADCTARTSLPPDPRQGSAVADVVRTLASIDVLLRVSRTSAARDEAEQLLREAEAVGDPAAEALVRSRLARAEHSLGHHTRARELYATSAVTSLEADDRLTAARAWSQLYLVAGVELGEPNADVWANLAAAVFDRTPGAGRDRAVLEAHRAHGLRAAGDLQGALERWTTAVRLMTEAKGESHPDVAKARVRRAEVLSFLGGGEDTIEELESAMQIQIEAYGRMHRGVATTLSVLGAAHLGQDEAAAAVKRMEEALQIQRQVLGTEHPNVARTLANLGTALLRDEVRDDERAVTLLEEALRITARAEGGRGIQRLTIQNTLAIVLARVGRDNEALTSRAQVLDELDAFGESTPLLATFAHLGQANLLRKLKRYDEALEHARRSVTLAEDAFGSDHPQVAYALLEEAGIQADAGTPDPMPLLRAQRIAADHELTQEGATELRVLLDRVRPR